MDAVMYVLVLTITDLRDHGIIVDTDVTSFLDSAVYTDLTERGAEERIVTQRE